MGERWNGEGARMTAGEVLAGRGPASMGSGRLPGERVVGCLRQAGREATFADLAAQEVALVQDVELRCGLEAVATVASALERARVRMACEAAAGVAHRGGHEPGRLVGFAVPGP